MQVCEAQEGAPVEPNCVYVIPTSHYLGIRDGVLYLAEPVTEHGIRMPIDYFFRTLAEDRQERAICILFSGAGSDGTMGVRTIRGAGGLTIAQDQTAQFGEMPRSAVATGLVDLVLRPDQMPKAIVDYLRQPYVRRGEPPAVLDAEGKPDGFNEILYLVRVQTGCDFQCYKKSSIRHGSCVGSFVSRKH
jgi:two-component system CheB/CheR fusion protein